MSQSMRDLHIKINDLDVRCNKVTFEKDLISNETIFKIFLEDDKLYGIGRLNNKLNNITISDEITAKSTKAINDYEKRQFNLKNKCHIIVYIPENHIVITGFGIHIQDMTNIENHYVLFYDFLDPPEIEIKNHLGNNVIVIETKLENGH